RIQKAAAGEDLTTPIRLQIDGLARDLLGDSTVDSCVVVGNTVMLHLLFGADCSGLGRYPYTPEFLDCRQETGAFFRWDWTDKVLSPPCLHAFCGADITAGLLTILNSDAGFDVLLADLGTNAELALLTRDKILLTSAAAGPVFEGHGLLYGMPALDGAISGFSLLGEQKRMETVGDAPPKGVCASGLIDVLAALRRQYVIDKNGVINGDYRLVGELKITQKDVRSFQLAKAAVAAGIRLLCDREKVDTADMDIRVSGALGSAMDFENACALGLFPRALSIKALGNSALEGGKIYANSPDAQRLAQEIARRAEYLDLSLLPEFQDVLLGEMNF
ncbi:MAG: ASKHA domain-containing protein, partial [Oscillospiraceae bacterium]|nr:ASKHA domain-containing protein [Oscillospiraceae bacterium]